MKFYRESIPAASVLPKMHMLEDHVMSFVRQYRVELGLMGGEQGAESIHATINTITYTSIPEKVNRLECVMKEHHRQVCPILVAQKPEAKKRKFTNPRQ